MGYKDFNLTMKFELDARSRQRLQATTPDSPAVVELRGGRETALAMRVEEVFSYRRPLQPFVLNCVGYQAKGGAWVVTFAFQLGTESERYVAGRVYLNPLQNEDAVFLQHLALQERFVFVFLNTSLSGGVSQERVWLMEERYRVRLLLSQTGRAVSQRPANTSEFEQAKAEFDARFSLSHLLTTQTPTPTGGAGLPSFHGAVHGAVLE